MDLWFYRLELFKEPNDDTIKFKKNVVNEINKATKTSLNLVDTIKKLFPSLTDDEIKKISDAKKEDLNKLPICVQLYIIDGVVKTVWDILSEGINIYDYYIRKIDFENMKDRPKQLDDETIDKIVERVFYYQDDLGSIASVTSLIPRIKGAVLKAREYVTNRGIEWFKKELKSVLISRSSIEQLTTLCEHDLISSIAVPGTAVGILVGESLGSMNTQVILNTFHSSGQDTSASMNTNSYSDILGASENPNAINTVVSFNNKYITYEEAYRKRADIMGISFKDVLLDNIEIERLDKIGGFQWWHNPVITKDLNSDEIVLRLHFDINRLYSHEIDLETLKDKILDIVAISPKNMSSKDDKFLKDGLAHVFCSPTHVGIIDIYPNRDVVISVMNSSPFKCEKDNDNCIRLYLKIFVLDELKKTKIKGIEGIVGIFPQIEPVMQIILEEKNKNDPAIQSIMLDEDIENPDHLWVLYLNKIRMRMTGIKAENVSYLLSLCGIRTLLIVEEKAYMIVLSEEKPTKAVLKNVKKDKDRSKYLIKEKIKGGVKGYIKYRTELINASEYIYLIIRAEKGTETLSELMCKRYIDPQHTYSSNSHELTKLIGIEAAYNYIYNTLNDVSDAVGGANRRHIDVVTQVITRNGKPKGLKTQSRESASGFLSRSTFSKASAIIITEAISGAKEGMFSPSTAIMTGQVPKIGTGYNKINNEELNEDFLDEEEGGLIGDRDREVREEYERIEIGEAGEDFDYAGDKVITNLNPAVQSYEEFKKEQLVPIESLYKLNIKAGKANKVIIDDIPTFTLKPSQNLQGYLPGIVRLLDKYSTFKFGSINIEDLHLDLPEKQIRKILMDVVTLTDVNTNTENSIDRGIDEFSELLSIADEFA